MSSDLTKQKCVSCEGGMPAMSEDGIIKNLEKISGWNRDNITITKNFTFEDFKQAVQFVNKVSELAENEGHHPDLNLHSYKNVKVTLSTHAVGGLSVNDFILAAKIDEITA